MKLVNYLNLSSPVMVRENGELENREEWAREDTDEQEIAETLEFSIEFEESLIY